MSSSPATVHFILDAINGAGTVTARKMFGEYGVYCDGKFVALICDDTFFIKETTEGMAFAPELEFGTPYPGAKPHPVISGDRLEDHDWVCELIRITTLALPEPRRSKPGRKPKASA